MRKSSGEVLKVAVCIQVFLELKKVKGNRSNFFDLVVTLKIALST